MCKCLHLYGLFIFRVFGLKPEGTILTRSSNKRSWAIYGEDYPTSALQQVQGRFAKSCPSIRETSIVLQED